MAISSNDDRAAIGETAVSAAARRTGVDKAAPASLAISDVLAYIAHFCDAGGLDPRVQFELGLDSYEGDFEDFPRVEAFFDADRVSLEDLAESNARVLEAADADEFPRAHLPWLRAVSILDPGASNDCLSLLCGIASWLADDPERMELPAPLVAARAAVANWSDEVPGEVQLLVDAVAE